MIESLDRYKRWSKKFDAMLEFNDSLAQLSTCKKRRVGCIIIPPDFSNVLAIGYNGPPAGISHESCDCLGVGGKLCVHAEANALLKLSGNNCVTNCCLIVSLAPCQQCAGLIVNSRKIKLVIYQEHLVDTRGLTLLNTAGIPAFYAGDIDSHESAPYLLWRCL